MARWVVGAQQSRVRFEPVTSRSQVWHSATRSQESNSKRNSIKKHNLLLIIVDVSALTGAFVGTVCLIALCRSVLGRTGCRRCGRVGKTPRLCSSTCLAPSWCVSPPFYWISFRISLSFNLWVFIKGHKSHLNVRAWLVVVDRLTFSIKSNSSQMNISMGYLYWLLFAYFCILFLHEICCFINFSEEDLWSLSCGCLQRAGNVWKGSYCYWVLWQCVMVVKAGGFCLIFALWRH